MKKLFQILLTAGLLLSVQTGSAQAAVAGPEQWGTGTFEDPFANEPDPNGSFEFEFPVALFTIYYIDPDIAVGYDYVVEQSSPNIASVLLPSVGDNFYDLWFYDTMTSDYYDAGITIAAGVSHYFGPSGVNQFRIMGIETSAMLDPTDPTAFVTGLTFTGNGTVDMTQTPVTAFVVPEPSSMLLLGVGMAGLLYSRRRGVLV